MDAVVEVQGLKKSYGAKLAVDDVSFAIDRGEIFGIVGPNGAGKTSTVECITGLRSPDGGSVRVLGLDPRQQPAAVRQRIGIQLQSAALQDRLRVAEALKLFSSFYDHPIPWEPLLDRWGMDDQRDTAFGALSGGQQQRLFIMLALINDPKIVVLDELTAGLDPHARRRSWDLIREIRANGTTVLLVTHAMDEAQQLCDRVAVIENGRILALDSPAALVRDMGGALRVRFTPPDAFDLAELTDIPGLAGCERTGAEVVLSGASPLMARVATWLAGRGIVPADLRTEQRTLEDVFIQLTHQPDHATGGIVS
ncbi:MAG: ABC transporter ATP-binding protein [Thermomicrobiales bacterium]